MRGARLLQLLTKRRVISLRWRRWSFWGCGGSARGAPNGGGRVEGVVFIGQLVVQGGPLRSLLMELYTTLINGL